MTDILRRNNVIAFGQGKVPMLFVHGYGCDQNMWRMVTPAFEDEYHVILMDHVGSGGSDWNAYDVKRYSHLKQYTSDLLEVCAALKLKDAVLVLHSVSAMIGLLAAIEAPQYFSKLIMIGPSPCYINKGDYVGGFEENDILEMLEALDRNFLGWSSHITPVIMGNPERPELAEELHLSFCRHHPDIAKNFAKATFLSDNRADLSRLKAPTLILQSEEDVIAQPSVGEYVHAHIPNSKLIILPVSGHCPHLSHPEQTIQAMQNYLHERL